MFDKIPMAEISDNIIANTDIQIAIRDILLVNFILYLFSYNILKMRYLCLFLKFRLCVRSVGELQAKILFRHNITA